MGDPDEKINRLGIINLPVLKIGPRSLLIGRKSPSTSAGYFLQKLPRRHPADDAILNPENARSRDQW